MRLIDLDSDYIQETLYRRGFKTRQDIEEWLNFAPTIDAAPVVRCKDCIRRYDTAEFVSKYFTNGQLAIVSGRLQIRPWTDDNGNKRRSTEVVAEHVYYGGGCE